MDGWDQDGLLYGWVIRDELVNLTVVTVDDHKSGRELTGPGPS